VVPVTGGWDSMNVNENSVENFKLNCVNAPVYFRLLLLLQRREKNKIKNLDQKTRKTKYIFRLCKMDEPFTNICVDADAHSNTILTFIWDIHNDALSIMIEINKRGINYHNFCPRRCVTTRFSKA
jgi:hypothetical protein